MAAPTSAVTVKFDSTTVSGVGSVDLNLFHTPIETTAVGDAYRVFEHGFKEATVDLELFYDSSVASHVKIPEGIDTATYIADVEIVWQTVSSTAKKVSGKCIVNSFRMNITPNNAVQVTASLTFANGAITVVG
jgi:hypothetical protein